MEIQARYLRFSNETQGKVICNYDGAWPTVYYICEHRATGVCSTAKHAFGTHGPFFVWAQLICALPNKSTSWKKSVVEKLIVAQLVNKLPAFCDEY